MGEKAILPQSQLGACPWTGACLTASWGSAGRARPVAFVAGSRWLGLRGGGCQLVPLEGFLDALGGGGADALVDRKGLPQADGGLGGVAVLKVAVAGAFQSTCFL